MFHDTHYVHTCHISRHTHFKTSVPINSLQDIHVKTHIPRHMIQDRESNMHIPRHTQKQNREAEMPNLTESAHLVQTRIKDILGRMFARHRSPSAWQSKPCPVRIRLPQTSDALPGAACRRQARIMHPLLEHGSLQLYITSWAWRPSPSSSSGCSRSAFEA